MVTTVWNRLQQSSGVYSVGSFRQDIISSGFTLRRIRWAWGFAGVTADTVDINATVTNHLIGGIVTTVGDGSEAVPNPVTTPVDVAPPTQRWLWWETRVPVPIAVDHAAGLITWRDSGPQEVPDVGVNVLATGIPPGDFLNVWFSWASVLATDWDPSGSVDVWASTSILSTTP